MAETSITIDDVVFVTDCGKAKETSYDALNNNPCLLPAWISKVFAKQRRGRVGRVQLGECYHLYPQSLQSPELLAVQSAIKYLKRRIKRNFSRDHSDHFALVRVYEGWKVAEYALGGYEYFICYDLYPGNSSIVLLNPKLDLHTHHELLSACAYSSLKINPPPPQTQPPQLPPVSRVESGPGGDNS
ncbi:unnamed protein product [Lactuca virosa]|uniref:RNA helicase n=1 Tax=Lactuca virosa TaxID=75947 RepID=A0AAU9MN70_9ASTR|nr:unnamed protein product [Lactuca virosa]